MRKSILAVALVLLVACGGSPDVFLDPDPKEAVAFELPDPVPAAPAYVARLPNPLKNNRLRAVSKTPGIAVLAPVSVREVKVQGPGGAVRLKVAAVDPLPYRSVAPPSTRDAEFVWTALMSNRAIVTFDAAKRLGLEEAKPIAVAGLPVEIGAFAENGIPNIADVVISTQLSRGFKLGAPNVLVVGAKSGVTIQTLGRDLKRKLPNARLQRIRTLTSSVTRPAAPEPVAQVSGATIGTMTFRILKNGFIDPDDSWVAANISSASVPVFGSVRCHRIMLPQLAAALGEVQDRGLASEIRTYDGCYVPRFIDRNPRRGLSMHAFGLAIDINASTNRLGTRGDVHPDIVAIFEKWGFAWGGRWGRPDPMHFELARIVRPS